MPSMGKSARSLRSFTSCCFAMNAVSTSQIVVFALAWMLVAAMVPGPAQGTAPTTMG